MFAAGKRNAFYRGTGRRPLRNARGGLPQNHYVVRTVFFGNVENGGILRRVTKRGGVVTYLARKTLGYLFLWEIDPGLFLASPEPPDRGHYGRCVHLDRSRLQFPKHYGKKKGAPDWSTITGRASHTG